MKFLRQIEREAKRRDSRLVLLSLPDFWHLARETKLLGDGSGCTCTGGRHTCVAVPDVICLDDVRLGTLHIMPTPSFDTHPLFLHGNDPYP